MSLEKIKFSTPVPIPDRWGVIKYVRRWPLPHEPELREGFWKFWKKNKTKMMGKGMELIKSKSTGNWELLQWRDDIKDFPIYEKKPEIDMVTCLDPKPLNDESGLKPWQIPSTSVLVASIKKWGAAIDGSDTGTGKTYSAIGAARELGMKVYVVCPLVVVEAWRRVIVNHFNLEYVNVVNYESLRTGKLSKEVSRERSKLSTIENFVWHIPKDTLIIFDESHRLKNRNTLNAKLAISAKHQGYKILCLSATNAIDPRDLNAVGEIIGLHKGGQSFYKFLNANDCKKGAYGFEFGGSKYILRKLHKEMFIDRGQRLKKDDIPEFPDSEIVAEPYMLQKSTTEEINKIYKEVADEIKELRKREKKDKKAIEMTARIRARQKVELLKVPLFVELTEDLIEDGNSVVIMVNFRDTIIALSKRLNTKCIIWGDNEKNERQDNIDAFQSDESRVIIVNISAGGVGVSLHDTIGNHPRIALISPNDSATVLRQAFGRIHRTGAKTKSTQKVIFAANTVEEQVCNNVKMKLRNLDLLNDGELHPDFENILKE